MKCLKVVKINCSEILKMLREKKKKKKKNSREHINREQIRSYSEMFKSSKNNCSEMLKMQRKWISRGNRLKVVVKFLKVVKINCTEMLKM